MLLLPLQPLRVTIPVEPLVVLHHSPEDLLGNILFPQQLEALQWMPLHDPELLLGKLPGLVQDLPGHQVLAKIVEQGGHAQGMDIVLGAVEVAGIGHAEHGHVDAVGVRVLVVLPELAQADQGVGVARQAGDHLLHQCGGLVIVEILTGLDALDELPGKRNRVPVEGLRHPQLL